MDTKASPSDSRTASAVAPDAPKFTPGPWMRDERLVYALESIGWRGREEQFRNRFSASVQGPTTPADELIANAALIAAAPDLLKALRWAMRHLRGHVSFGSSGDAYERATNYELAGFVPKWDVAEAAIAKAEGR